MRSKKETDIKKEEEGEEEDDDNIIKCFRIV
jgi:hypothetical protein